ncbi:MAG: hypothetical protein AAF583_12805 [Pseudomonadota bacterium]
MNPALIDAILILLVIEFAGLLVFLVRRNRLNAAPAVAFFLLSGGAIMVALRLTLAGGPSNSVILGLLGASFLTHILTLLSVWKLINRD